MEQPDENDCSSDGQVCVKSEPDDMLEYEEIDIKLEDITHTPDNVHIKPEINDYTFHSEVDISHDYKLEHIDPLEYKDELQNHSVNDNVEPKLEHIDPLEYNSEDELRNDTFNDNMVEYSGSCTEESYKSFKFTTYSKWDKPDTPTNVIELSYKETLHLIKLYASEKILYDINHNDYTNKVLRVSAFERIADALNLPCLGPEEVMQGLRKLRNIYNLETKKISNRKTKGEVYKSTFFWYEHMNVFFRSFIRRYKQQRQELKIARKRDKQVKSRYRVKRIIPPTKQDLLVTEKPIEIDEQRIHSPGLQSSSLNIKKHGSETFGASNVKFRKPDSYDHFGSYVASLLRSIDPATAMRLQESITTCLIKVVYPPVDIPNTSSSR